MEALEGARLVGGCGHNCLNQCCIPGDEERITSFVIPGQFGFIAELNEGRHLKKRLTEFRVDKVLQPFDGSKFNFTKVEQDEVLFQLKPAMMVEIAIIKVFLLKFFVMLVTKGTVDENAYEIGERK
ncbi:unnamed protein product [Malus baccata var. baccata]